MPNLNIKVTGLDKIAKQLERNRVQAENVITRTVSDLRSRVPGWVAAEVTADYNIKKSDVQPAKKDKSGKWKKTAGSVRVKGETIATVQIVYEGRPLTPVHFAMKPKKPPKGTRGKKRKRVPITAEIKRGQRKELHPDAFLGTNHGGGYIPFRRTTKRRYPIESIKTVSLPQMVESETVYPNITQRINSELQKRLDHNLKQYFEKI